MDTSNILRVDISKIYLEAESRSVDIAESIDPTGVRHDVLVICGADYPQLHEFMVRGTSEIADRANYLNCDTETGLQAITAKCPTDYCCDTDLTTLPETPKINGELLDTSISNFILFNIPELENVDLDRRSVVQSYLKEAIISYLLSEWYGLKAEPSMYQFYAGKFENEVQKVRFNSITNKKTRSSRRKYRLY
jgi:hypothetical protein